MRHSSRAFLYCPNQSFVNNEKGLLKHQWLPRRLLLVRHGESQANVDRKVYSNTPDWCIPLTQKGREQAFDCGKRLRRIINDEKLYIYYSPYVRTRQTLEEIRKSIDDSQIQGEREDERLREQEMGNYQPLDAMDQTWAERSDFSRLYYRFPGGESSADVGDRVSAFFESLLRERIGLTVPNMNEGPSRDASDEVSSLGIGRWGGETRDGKAERHECHVPGGSQRHVSRLSRSVDADDLPSNDHGTTGGNDQNVVIVSHGLLIRLFIGRWFRVPMEVFETMQNPPNCAIAVLERNDEIGRLVMTDISKQLFGSDPLLQMMKFDGREDTQWYRERFLGITDPDKDIATQAIDDDDENHHSPSLGRSPMQDPLTDCSTLREGAKDPEEHSVSATTAPKLSIPSKLLHGCPSADTLSTVPLCQITQGRGPLAPPWMKYPEEERKLLAEAMKRAKW